MIKSTDQSGQKFQTFQLEDIGIKLIGRPLIYQKACWPKKTTVDRIHVVLQKGYVLYGITATLELVYRFLRRVDRKRCNLIYRWL